MGACAGNLPLRAGGLHAVHISLDARSAASLVLAVVCGGGRAVGVGGAAVAAASRYSSTCTVVEWACAWITCLSLHRNFVWSKILVRARVTLCSHCAPSSGTHTCAASALRRVLSVPCACRSQLGAGAVGDWFACVRHKALPTWRSCAGVADVATSCAMKIETTGDGFLTPPRRYDSLPPQVPL
jgi:hypothetical protein